MSAEQFPYFDIWDRLLPILDTFGVERCIWGTDWARTSNLLSYQQGIDAFRVTKRLSQDDKAMLLGGAAAKTYGWSPQRNEWGAADERERSTCAPHQGLSRN
jgi:L-fuconolactonase